MKNPHIIPKEDGLYLADLPEEPKIKCFEAHFITPQKEICKDPRKYKCYCATYDELEREAIKDAVKLKDQEFAKVILFISHSDVTKEDFEKNIPFKVDLSGYDVTTECGNYPCDGKNCKMVAILTPKSKSIVDHDRYYEIEKKENSAHSFTEGMFIAGPPPKRHDPDKLRERIKTLRDIKDNETPSVTEESQEELWNEVFKRLFIPEHLPIQNNLLKDFTIIRKPKMS